MSNFIRVALGQEDGQEQQQEEAPQHELVKSNPGSFHFDASTGNVAHKTTVTVTADDVQKAQRRSGILATAVTPSGSPAINMNPNCLVEIDGQMTPLSLAERWGYVRRDASGSYVETTEEERNVAPEAPTEEELRAEAERKAGLTVQQEAFEPAQEAALVEMVKDVPPESLGAAVIPAAIAAAKTGELKLNAEAFASATGMPQEQASKFLATVIPMFQAQADNALQKLEVDPQTFYAWAREHRPEALVQAAVNHLVARSLADYRKLAGEYLFNTMPTTEALHAKGFETKIDPSTRTPLVRINGFWQSVKAAARDGLV